MLRHGYLSECLPERLSPTSWCTTVAVELHSKYFWILTRCGFPPLLVTRRLPEQFCAREQFMDLRPTGLLRRIA